MFFLLTEISKLHKYLEELDDKQDIIRKYVEKFQCFRKFFEIFCKVKRKPSQINILYKFLYEVIVE